MFVIVIISCSEIAIVMTYFQLCAEDYHWWWRSFIASGGCAFYVFFYSIFYYSTEVSSADLLILCSFIHLKFDHFNCPVFQLEITEFVPTLLYFGYSFLISFTIWIITGTIGFYSSYLFVRKIYAAVKID